MQIIDWVEMQGIDNSAGLNDVAASLRTVGLTDTDEDVYVSIKMSVSDQYGIICKALDQEVAIYAYVKSLFVPLKWLEANAEIPVMVRVVLDSFITRARTEYRILKDAAH